MDDITLDRALTFSILQQDKPGYLKAKSTGISAEHVQDEDHKIFALMEQFVRKHNRLPTTIEIKADTGVDIIVPAEPYEVELFAGQIATRALQNKLKDGLGPITREVLSDPKKARAALQELIKQTAWSLGSVASYTDPAIADAIIDAYEKAKGRGAALLGYSSPWPNVDKHSLGLQPGELTVVLAKRKTGKTWILLKWFVHILRNDLQPGENLLVASMEMPDVQMYRRMAAIDLRLDYANFRSGRLTIEEERRLKDWVEAMRDGDTSRPTVHIAGADVIRSVGDICDKVAELNSKLVGLDGLYILGRDSKKAMWERTIDNVQGIKLDLCAGMNIGCLATSQFAGKKSKSDLKADADDAAYAKAIGDWADAMRGLFMNDEYEKNKRRVFRAMESREFQGVDLQIHFNLDTMDFSENHIMGSEDETPIAEEKKEEVPEDEPTIIPGVRTSEDDEDETEEEIDF